MYTAIRLLSIAPVRQLTHTETCTRHHNKHFHAIIHITTHAVTSRHSHSHKHIILYVNALSDEFAVFGKTFLVYKYCCI